MTGEQAYLILQEFAALRDPAAEPEQEAVKAALFLEDVFGVTLSDAQIDPEVLHDPEAMLALVAPGLGAD